MKKITTNTTTFINNQATRRLNYNFLCLSYSKKNFCSNDNTNNTTNTTTEPTKELKRYDGVVYNDHSKYLTEITLNTPAKYNALDLRMIRSILRKVRHWVPFNVDGFSSDDGEDHSSESPKVALFTGNGKAFCAGGDIVDLYKTKIKNNNTKALEDFFRYEYLLDYSLTKMNPIQISLWHGAVMGGGVGLSINSKYRIATDSALFAMPETKIGLFTDVGASYFLPRLLNNEPELGLYLGLTGEKIKGKMLAVTGVATHYVSLDKFDTIKKTIIENVNEKTDEKELDSLLLKHSDYTYNKEEFTLPHLETIREVFKVDSLEEIFNRLTIVTKSDDKEKAEWAQKHMDNLNKYSPLSLSVVLEQIKRGIEMTTIEEAFNVETQLVSSFMEDSDFFEGVRALLVDKDNKPVWKHKSYKEVDYKSIVDQYFERHGIVDVDKNL